VFDVWSILQASSFLFSRIKEDFFLNSGWMNTELFYQRFEQIFLQHTKDLPRPILLIMDGYGCHFSVETLRLAINNNV
jgi:hypothetical protein